MWLYDYIYKYEEERREARITCRFFFIKALNFIEMLKIENLPCDWFTFASCMIIILHI
jgi:hypothetical protein